MSIEHTTRVRFHQADPAGVLFFGRVFELVSDAFEETIRGAIIPFDEPFPKRDFLVPIVHVDADYQLPIRVGEEVTVSLTIERIGRSSLGYRFAIIDRDSRTRVSGSVVHTFVEASSFSTIEIPAAIRAKLEALQP